ncbi:MAG: family 10 glycosylhydrolase [Myxococcota bacterium]|nr:family 10 glycosylhydrolase [Myxococcota bacterium]
MMLLALLTLSAMANPVENPSPTDSSAHQVRALPPGGEELRGVWVTRWSYDSQEDVERILTDISRAGFNAVFFQVRGSFDAFYQSSIEPWAERLTGSLGTDPGWDPLQTAIKTGHELGLQIHAYINVFPLSSGEHAPQTGVSPEHAYNAHPDWRVSDQAGRTPIAGSKRAKAMKYVFASPGNPQVRARITAVAADIDNHYDIDGIHLDYIRYPGRQYSHDPVSLSRRDASASLGNWQRSQIEETIARVREAVTVPVTAAVWGVYENRWGWASVSEGRNDYYQDSRAFLKKGLVDATMPMIYWPVSSNPGSRLDFHTLASDHLSNASGRHVYLGITAQPSETAEDFYQHVVRCIEAGRALNAPGFVLFDYVTGKDLLERLGTGPLAEEAVPPTMPWRD